MGLTLAGSLLEPILKEFEAELERAGIRRLRPRFYLSTEWGVPFGTANAVPEVFDSSRRRLLSQRPAVRTDSVDHASLRRKP